MKIFGIDPGVRYLGWAQFDAGSIVEAGTLEQKPNTYPLVAAVSYGKQLRRIIGIDHCTVCVEAMEWRPGSAERVSDVLAVQFVSAFLVGMFAQRGQVVMAPQPHSWKESQPKAIHQMLMGEKIPGWDVVMKVPETRREHAADAAGLAWWAHLGGKERV